MLEFKLNDSEDKLSQEEQEVLNAAIEIVAFRYFDQNNGLFPDSIGLRIGRNHCPLPQTQKKMTNQDVFQLVTALVKPETLRGCL